MPLPTPLSRRKKNVHKNTFGHILILAGSRRMLGAAALTSLSAMRTGAGLVTVGVPESLNKTLQKKISHVVMTWPLPETSTESLSLTAFPKIQEKYDQYSCIVLGPGLSRHPSTQKLILRIIATSPIPLVIDADALNALANHCEILLMKKSPKILTPHPGEMARLVRRKKATIEKNRKKYAENFAKKYNVTLLLKGPRTTVAKKGARTYINRTGNSGMATAGSGDVLTGMTAALVAQGLSDFEAAKWGARLHGIAGDKAAKKKTRASMIATDIIDAIPRALKSVK